MTGGKAGARARIASGRSVVPCLLAALLGSCQLAGTVPGPGDAGTPDPVRVGSTPVSGADEAAAAELVRSAESSLVANRYFEALRATTEVLERYAGSSSSGRALLLGARAELGVALLEGGEEGEAARARALEAAERYASLVPAGDARAAEAYLIQAEALTGDPAARLDRLLRLEGAARADVLSRALPMAQQAADSLASDQLETALARAPAGSRLAHVVETRLAVYRLEDGDSIAADDLARAALDGGAAGEDARVAEGVLRGELPEGRGRVTSATIATVLPLGGSPALADFARLVAEGVDVAVAAAGEGLALEVVGTDDEGNAEMVAGLVAELESRGVAGIIGFLEDFSLEIAGLSRERGVPLVSPTARNASRVGQGVYSLAGPDPRAAALLADYAASRGHRRVAIVHPSTPEAAEEADAFQVAAARHGIPTVARLAYQPGATFFEPQIMGARDSLRLAEIAALGLGEEDTLRVEMLEPVALFLPIPPEDVEFLAPQIRHFGLDTLAIDILGTSGWTDPQVLETMDPSYANGVVATAPEDAGPGSVGMTAFRLAYEEHFQRTLVSAVPALGYDAALLLIEALRLSRGTAPEQVMEGFRQLEAVRGATGIYSVVENVAVPRPLVGVVGTPFDTLMGVGGMGDPVGAVADTAGARPDTAGARTDTTRVVFPAGDPAFPMGGRAGAAGADTLGLPGGADSLSALGAAGRTAPSDGVRLIRHSDVVRIQNGRLEPVEYEPPPPIG